MLSPIFSAEFQHKVCVSAPVPSTVRSIRSRTRRSTAFQVTSGKGQLSNIFSASIFARRCNFQNKNRREKRLPVDGMTARLSTVVIGEGSKVNRFKFHTLTLFYKIRNGLAPTYLSEILPETLALSSGRNLRRHVYPFPRINKSSTMQSFLPRATVFWNELPASIQSSSSLHSFKAKLRDLLKI